MSWLKGTRTDGFINIDKNVNFRGTVKGAGDGIMRPKGALDYYVDGTDGSDTLHSGHTWDGAFKTIQVAIAAQIAETKAKGDNIWIAPGTYAESLTGDLTSVQIIGSGVTANSVVIAPTASSSYVGTMTNAALRNLTFTSSSSTSPAHAACRIESMTGSVIDGCFFYAGTATALSTGFRLGAEAGDSAASDNYVSMRKSYFTNNVIGSGFGGKNFYFGFVFGASTTAGTNSRYRYVKDSLIAYNRISAEDYGMMLNVAYTTGTGAVIYRNTIMGGMLLAGQCSNTGIKAYDRGHDNKLIKVNENYVYAQIDCIAGFGKRNILGNYVGKGGLTATPTRELPAGA